MIYLDANASETLRPVARAAAMSAMDEPGNPSSIHGAGRAARRILEDSRARIARRFGAGIEDVVFTSGGTEANALAIAGLGAGRRKLFSAIEHDCVRTACRDGQSLAVDRHGVLDLAGLDTALANGGPALVCLMLANNETGVIQPVAEAAAICLAYGALLHVDAVQAAGRIGADIAALGAASMAISGHKMGGLKGAGALLLAPGVTLPPLIGGGGQERGRRGGTPPLPAIAAMAAAEAAPGEAEVLAGMRDMIEAAATDAAAVACGAGAARLANTTCLALPGVRSDTQVIALDLAGFAVSAGAACSSGKVARSHVLDAMGLENLSGCAIRVSLPWNATEAEARSFAEAYAAMAGRLARHAA